MLSVETEGASLAVRLRVSYEGAGILPEIARGSEVGADERRGPHETSIGGQAGRLQRWQQATTSRSGSSRRPASGGGDAFRGHRVGRLEGPEADGRGDSAAGTPLIRDVDGPRAPGRGHARAERAGIRRAGISPLDRRRPERRPVRQAHATPLGCDPDVLLEPDADAGRDAAAAALTIGGHRPARPGYPIREEA